MLNYTRNRLSVMTKEQQKHRGFTLVELMIVMAVMAIIAMIAVPAYNGYIEESRLTALRANVEHLRLALEDFFLENGTYATGNWLADGSDTSLETNIGWHPDGDGEVHNYAVTAGAACAINSCYSITVSSTIDTSATMTCDRSQTEGTFSCN
jgi:prepilin-type N-terminal cleavage/methylation domain-containing protein